MIPRRVIDEVGELDSRLSYHVDADYCKRIADAGYKCYYLPAAAVIHFDHKGGTMVSLRRRFRSLVEFHIGSYIFYCKHIRQPARSPMQIIVPVGLFCRFMLSIVAQAWAEVHDITISLAAKTGGGLRREPTAMTWSRTVWRAVSRSAPAAKPTVDC
jgi:GT2 family glycosyltransferase